MRRGLSFVYVKSLYKNTTCLYKKRSVVREAYIHNLYENILSVNFTSKIAYQVHVFFLQG